MTFGFFTGSFTKSTTTSGYPFNQDITNAAILETPKLVIVWTSFTTADDAYQDSLDTGFSYGFATGSTAGKQHSAGMLEDDGAANSAAWRWNINNSSTAWMRRYSATGILQHEFRLNSFLSNGFRITFNTINDAQPYIYNYFVMWGTEIEANSTSWNARTTAGTDVIPHGLAGAPDMQLYLSGAVSADNGSLAPAQLMIGMASGTATANQATMAIDVRNAQATMDTYRYMPANTALGILTPTSGAINALGTVSAIDATNVTVSWSDPSSAAWRISALFIKGANHNVHTILAPSAPGNQTKTGMAFQPQGLFGFSRGLAASTTSDAHASITVGASNVPVAGASPLLNFALYRPPNNAATKTAIDNAYLDSGSLRTQDWIGAYHESEYVEATNLANLTGCKQWIGKPFLNGTGEPTWTAAAYPGGGQGVLWAVYDLEGPSWPANSVVSQNEMATQAALAHSKGLLFCANLGDPTNDAGNILAMCSNPNVDAVHIQCMGQQTSQNTFVNFLTPRIAAARQGFAAQGNPQKPVFIGPSVSFTGTNDQNREPSYVLGLCNAVMAVAPYDGVHFFYGTPTAGTDVQHVPRLAEMMDLLFDVDTPTYRAASYVSEDATLNAEAAVRSTDSFMIESPSTAVAATASATPIPVMQARIDSFAAAGYTLAFPTTVTNAVIAVWAFASQGGTSYSVTVPTDVIGPISESLGRQLAAKRTVTTNTMTLTEVGPTKFRQVFSTVPTDTMAQTDDLAGQAGQSRTVPTDVMQMSDALSYEPHFNPSLSEHPMTLSETLTSQLAANRTVPTDTMTMSEQLSRQVTYNRTVPTDTMRMVSAVEFNEDEFNIEEFGVWGGIVSAVFSLGAAIQTEVMTLVESLASSFHLNLLVPTETITMDDSALSSQLAALRTVPTDTMGPISESILTGVSVTGAATLVPDVMALTEELSSMLEANRTVDTDVITFSEVGPTGALTSGPITPASSSKTTRGKTAIRRSTNVSFAKRVTRVFFSKKETGTNG